MDLRELQAEYLRQQRQVTDERIAVGALIRTMLSETDGLVFKNGRTEKPKRLVVIGVDHEQALCFGSVLVNTKLNPKAQYSAEYLSAQYELKQENYPEFLDYNSFVDCGELFSIPVERLKQGEFFSLPTSFQPSAISLQPSDLRPLSDIFSTKQKKRYGIRRR